MDLFYFCGGLYENIIDENEDQGTDQIGQGQGCGESKSRGLTQYPMY